MISWFGDYRSLRFCAATSVVALFVLRTNHLVFKKEKTVKAKKYLRQNEEAPFAHYPCLNPPSKKHKSTILIICLSILLIIAFGFILFLLINPSSTSDDTGADVFSSATFIQEGKRRISSSSPKCYGFTPISSATYKMWSAGNCEVRIKVYNSDKALIAQDVSGGDFQLSWHLQKNETYYIIIDSNTYPFTTTFYVEK